MKEKYYPIVQDFGDYKILASAVKQSGLFTLVIFRNGIGSADERKIAGLKMFSGWNLTCYFFSSVRFDRKTKECS